MKGYKVVFLSLTGIRNSLELEINRMAKGGWKLFSFTPYSGDLGSLFEGATTGFILIFEK